MQEASMALSHKKIWQKIGSEDVQLAPQLEKEWIILTAHEAIM